MLCLAEDAVAFQRTESGTFSIGSPSSRMISKSWPGCMSASSTLVRAKLSGHFTPLRSLQRSG